eukprot:g13226.t1
MAVTWAASAVILIVGLGYGPETGIKEWARDEALARNVREAEGLPVEYGKIYSQEPRYTFTAAEENEDEEEEDDDDDDEEDVGLPSASRDEVKLTRFAEEDVTDVGLGDVHPIGAEEKEVEEDLVESLEEGDQITVVGDVQLGELLCDSLASASGATLLRFAISPTEAVIAERTSYTSVDGSVLPDSKERKLWMGEVVDPEPPAGSVPRTVSMAWTDPCDVESFLLKVVSRGPDGSTSIVKSVPCDAGSSTELCMVELDVDFNPTGDAQEADSEDPVSNSAEEDVVVPVTLELPHGQELRQVPGDRRLMGTTEIDVLVLYSSEIYSSSAEEVQLLSSIVAGFATVNEATVNSDIDLQFNLVRVDKLPYSQTTYDLNDTPTEIEQQRSDELGALKNSADVLAIRDEVQADLVLLVGEFPGTCGLGYLFQVGRDDLGYSFMDDDCFDNFTHSHEMGHNLGCEHDKANALTTTATSYNHGWRYCASDDAVVYKTIMSYRDGCDVVPPTINHFSNPDVNYLGLPTGTSLANNAQCIKDSMVAVSNFRTEALTCADIGGTCTTADDCCSDFCGSAGVCAHDICGGAGGDVLTIGDSVCDAGNNNEACEYDGGDCCECDCVERTCGVEDDACTTPVWNCVDSPVQNGPNVWLFAGDFCDTFSADDLGDCDYFGGATCDCTCVEGGDTLCGTGTGFDCCNPDSTCGPQRCATDADCTVDGEECCLVKKVCEVPDTNDLLACGDPHMTGFRGQTFDFTGADGEWYCLISDLPSMHLNMRITTPVPSVPEITYITGLSVFTTDAEGFDHSIVIEVTNPHSLESACSAGVSPCLADGALSVFIDGSEELVQPGTVSVAQGVTVSAVNLPGECRSFGFEKYWERKRLEYAQATGRRLLVEQPMGEWVLGDPTATNLAECAEFVARATTVCKAGLFEHQSEHVSFQIVLPAATVRLSHGRLHQLSMRDPTDQFDLPEHTTWQMNIAVDHNDVSRDATGVLGETLVPTLDDRGTPIMRGMGAIRGSQEDYRVEGALGIHFAEGEESH